jgi:hypothetical protein
MRLQRLLRLLRSMLFAVHARRLLQWRRQPMHLKLSLCLLRSALRSAHARRPIVMAAAARAAVARALLAVLGASLSKRTPPPASAASAHAAVAIASLAAFDTSLSAHTPPFASVVAAHSVVALASLAALESSLSARRTLLPSAAVVRVAVAQWRLLRLLLSILRWRAHAASSIGGGSSCGCRTRFACCARRFTQLAESRQLGPQRPTRQVAGEVAVAAEVPNGQSPRHLRVTRFRRAVSTAPAASPKRHQHWFDTHELAE